MDLTFIKIRDLLFIIIGSLVATGTIANALLLFTVWNQYQVEGSTLALYKVYGSFFLAVVSTIVLVIAVITVLKYLSTPIKTLTHVMAQLSQKKLDIQIPYTSQKNEFGDMSRTLEIFRDNLMENKLLNEAQEEQNRKHEEEKAQALENAVKSFNEQVQSFIHDLRGSMDELTQESEELKTIAQNGLHSAENLQNASQDASSNITHVLDAAQKMRTATEQAVAQLENSEQVSVEATHKADNASKSIAELEQSAGKIDGVVTLIRDIAKETNLLALNATIEAARAGQNGKSFAVVAGDVKKLAMQTSDATEDINEQVETVKGSVDANVTQMNDIGRVIVQMNDNLNVVSDSMRTQRATSQDIADNAQNAAAASNTLRETSENVYQGAQRTNAFAQQLSEVSQRLIKKTDSLDQEMRSFFDNLKGG